MRDHRPHVGIVGARPLPGGHQVFDLNVEHLRPERALDLRLVVFEVEHAAEHVPHHTERHGLEPRVEGDHVDPAVDLAVGFLVVDAARNRVDLPRAARHLLEAAHQLHQSHKPAVAKHAAVVVGVVELIAALRPEHQHRHAGQMR